MRDRRSAIPDRQSRYAWRQVLLWLQPVQVVDEGALEWVLGVQDHVVGQLVAVAGAQLQPALAVHAGRRLVQQRLSRRYLVLAVDVLLPVAGTVAQGQVYHAAAAGQRGPRPRVQLGGQHHEGAGGLSPAGVGDRLHRAADQLRREVLHVPGTAHPYRAAGGAAGNAHPLQDVRGVAPHRVAALHLPLPAIAQEVVPAHFAPLFGRLPRDTLRLAGTSPHLMRVGELHRPVLPHAGGAELAVEVALGEHSLRQLRHHPDRRGVGEAAARQGDPCVRGSDLVLAAPARRCVRVEGPRDPATGVAEHPPPRAVVVVRARHRAIPPAGVQPPAVLPRVHPRPLEDCPAYPAAFYPKIRIGGISAFGRPCSRAQWRNGSCSSSSGASP